MNLPIYVVLDCSGGMYGEPMEALKEWLRTLHAGLLFNPVAFESVQMAVITFGDFPRLVTPLTDIAAFIPPELEAAGLSGLGAALDLLHDCLREQHSRTGANSMRPIVLLVTDGCATDDWMAAVDRLRSFAGQFQMIALPCGSHADLDALRLITPHIHSVREVTGHFFEPYLSSDAEPIRDEHSRAGVSSDGSALSSLTSPPSGITLSLD